MNRIVQLRRNQRIANSRKNSQGHGRTYARAASRFGFNHLMRGISELLDIVGKIIFLSLFVYLVYVIVYGV